MEASGSRTKLLAHGLSGNKQVYIATDYFCKNGTYLDYTCTSDLFRGYFKVQGNIFFGTP